MNQVLPYGEVSRLGQNIELVAHNLVEHLIVQHGGNLVDGIGIERLDHRLALQVAKAVSYTHLDVYKRQAANPPPPDCNCRPCKTRTPHSQARSTHLRQGSIRPLQWLVRPFAGPQLSLIHI